MLILANETSGLGLLAKRRNQTDSFVQGCGSGFNDFVDPDSESESGSMGKKKGTFP
jgi:hypothetical protein